MGEDPRAKAVMGETKRRRVPKPLSAYVREGKNTCGNLCIDRNESFGDTININEQHNLGPSCVPIDSDNTSHADLCDVDVSSEVPCGAVRDPDDNETPICTYKTADENVSDIIQNNIELVKKLGDQAITTLMGLAMKEVRGKASGKMVNDLLRKKVLDL